MLILQRCSTNAVAPGLNQKTPNRLPTRSKQICQFLELQVFFFSCCCCPKMEFLTAKMTKVLFWSSQSMQTSSQRSKVSTLLWSTPKVK